MNKIYVLLDPISEEVMYVGQTSNRLNDRLCSHLWEAKKSGRKNKRLAWLRSLLNKNLTPIIKELETVPNREEANKREIFWIDYWKKINPKLKNQQPGGEGQPKGYKIKNRYSAPKNIIPKQFQEFHNRGGVKGRKKSKEERERFSKLTKGKPKYGLRKKIIVENVILNTRMIFYGYSEVCKYYNIHKTKLSKYLAGTEKYLFKNMFNIYYPKNKKKLLFKKIYRIYNNTVTLKFDSIVNCANFLDISRDIVYNRIKTGKEIKGYKICQIV